MKLSRSSVRAMRRKIKIFREWLDKGKLAAEDIFQSLNQSWRAHALRCNSYDTLRTMDEKFVRLFEAELVGAEKEIQMHHESDQDGGGLDLQAARLSQRGGSSGMNYVTHHRYKELALCGERLNIPYGTELHTEGYSLVLPDGREVCYSTSENAKKHFARNDDGRGLERGALTYAIAYSNRERYSAEGRRQRFSDEGNRDAGKGVGTLPAAGLGGNSVQRGLSLRRSRRNCKSSQTH